MASNRVILFTESTNNEVVDCHFMIALCARLLQLRMGNQYSDDWREQQPRLGGWALTL